MKTVEMKLREVNDKVRDNDLKRSLGASMRVLTSELEYYAKQDDELKQLLENDKLTIEYGSAYHMPRWVLSKETIV